MYNFLTVAVGPKYGADYVNRSFNMVHRHFCKRFTMHCITDNAEGLHPAIKVITPTHGLKGWWNKMYMFSPLMPEGRLIYIDLDMLIVNDCTELLTSYDGDYCGDEDHIHFGEGIFGNGKQYPEFGPIDCSLGTALVSMKAHAFPEVWSEYLLDQDRVEKVFHRHGDQVFTSWVLGKRFDLWERLYPASHGIGSYRFDVLGQHPHEPRPPRPHTDFKFINFHGDPKPAALVDTVPWVADAWR